ncbi:hypothetical protein [Limisphaera sp. 4302-co]|uniref:hypothetical protein n=1 Tax=Limisphaera sp. 4302-co TaxID=3400417 RepID=UPI003C19092C
MSWRRCGGWIAAVALAGLVESGAAVGTVAFQLQGVVRVEEYAPDGTVLRRDPKEIAKVVKALDPTVIPPLYPKAVPFLVCISNDWWYIRVQYGSNQWYEYGCDGRDTFAITYFPHVRGADIAGVSAGVTPQHMEMEAGVLWFALCSGKYFAREDRRDLAAPWGLPTMDPFAHVYELKGSFTNEEYRLPAFVWFEVVERRLQQAAQHPQLWPPKVLKEDVARLAQLKPGTTGAVYRAWDWRRVGEVQVPSRFELEIMYHRWRGDERQPPLGDNGVFLRYTGHITNVAAAVGHVGPPPVLGKLVVTDWRLQDREVGLEYVSYPITNRVWLTTNDPTVWTRFERRRFELMSLRETGIRGRTTPAGMRGVAVIAAIIAANLGIGAWLWVGRTRSRV